MKIYLIGLPGSGKTTLGKQLAQALNLPFIDLDKEIEKKENLSIPELFSAKGEEYFRLCESGLLHEWATSQNDFVMATGGGAPCFHNGIDVINDSGISIFLDISLNVIAKRLEHSTDRPLLNNENAEERFHKLSELRKKRLSVYNQASFSASNPTVELLKDFIQIKN